MFPHQTVTNDFNADSALYAHGKWQVLYKVPAANLHQCTDYCRESYPAAWSYDRVREKVDQELNCHKFLTGAVIQRW